MHQARRGGFTLIEMLVVIAIIATLIALIFPAVSGALEKGKVTQDLNNLRQIGLATQMYLNDNDGAYPLPTGGTTPWTKSLNPKYISTWKTFQSPFDKTTAGGRTFGDGGGDGAAVSYGMNGGVTNTSNSTALLSDQVVNPSVFIIFAPTPDASLAFSGTAAAPASLSQPGASAQGTHNRRQRINACMADWHVENMAWLTFSGHDTNDKCAAARWTNTACQ